jgi:hypothetical protein
MVEASAKAANDWRAPSCGTVADCAISEDDPAKSPTADFHRFGQVRKFPMLGKSSHLKLSNLESHLKLIFIDLMDLSPVLLKLYSLRLRKHYGH